MLSLFWITCIRLRYSWLLAQSRLLQAGKDSLAWNQMSGSLGNVSGNAHS